MYIWGRGVILLPQEKENKVMVRLICEKVKARTLPYLNVIV
jgi:hypothetical protein